MNRSWGNREEEKMRGIQGIAAVAVLVAGMAGWAAWATIGWAQGQYKLPPENLPAPVGDARPAKDTHVKQVQGTTPAQPEKTLPTLPDKTLPAAADKAAPIATTEESHQGALVNDEGVNGPGVEPSNTTGRQEPAVSLEWIGPPTAKVGHPSDYTIAIRNVCNIPVQQVMVRIRIPAGMSVSATEPKPAAAENNVLMWELGTMLPRTEKNLQMKLVAEGKGSMGCQAWVTFTGSSANRIKVIEPKLVVKAQAPEKVLVGDGATFVLTVTNPGDGPAEQVKLHAALSEGLKHPKGNKVDFELGNLNAGETRSVQVICATDQGGTQICDAVAEAEGDLKAQDKASVNVIMPRLALEIAGPKRRYLDRKAIYTLKVTNPGDAPATNVTLNDVVPAGFKYTSSSDGGRHDFSTRTVTWFVGEIAPGASKEVKMECMAINLGEFKFLASAQAARGLKEQKDHVTTVEGLSAIMLEVVDTEDPIEVGADTAYEIRVTNTGSKTETNLKLVCTIPDEMQFKTAQGPAHFHEQGKEIVFDELPKLAPRADAIYRVMVKGIAQGDVRFKAQITSTNLIKPVIEMESTRIYEDQ
jgi:uncharacterized repeat protein (TIGR01451 family)